MNASSVSYRPRSLSVALARSRSISLSPSPDKSESEVVGIASNPYRVHQTEYIRRQYCNLKIYYNLKILHFINNNIYNYNNLNKLFVKKFIMKTQKDHVILIILLIVSRPG